MKSKTNNHTNSQGIKTILAINQKHAKEFSDKANERRRYRSQHPTEFGCLKCMDGRLNLAYMTKSVLGIIQPWRNVGGKFDLGWPFLGLKIKNWTEYAVSKGRHAVVFVTYHYSRGDTHRGCAGFGYDTEGARKFTADLKKQFDSVYKQSAVYSIQCGIETDYDALILHGYNGEVIDLSSVTSDDKEVLIQMLHRLFPTLPEQVINDLLPLVQGNVQHIQETIDSKRPVIEVEHNEWIIAVGMGFDWLHLPNKALIIGPYVDMDAAIKTAATVIKGNIDAGRIRKNVVLMTCAPFRDPVGAEPKFAEEKAKFLMKRSIEVIKREVPSILSYCNMLTATVDSETRAINVIHKTEKKRKKK